MAIRPTHDAPAAKRLAANVLRTGLRAGLCAAVLGLGLASTGCVAQSGTAPAVQVGEMPVDTAPTYADLVELALHADLVGIVVVDEQITMPPERTPGLAPGHVRLYVEALTQSVLASPRAIGEELVFLVDLPLDARGKAPRIKKQAFLVFGDLDPSRPRDLQLLRPEAMMPTGPVIEQRVRHVLTQLAAANKPSPITGIKDVISIPGNLVGESETQIFVETEAGMPVSMNVIRRPGMAPRWGISLGDIVDPSARPPAPETLAWYHFACHLPRELPQDAFLQRERAAQAQARADYALILEDLGPCEKRL